MAQRLLGPNGFVQAVQYDDGTVVIYWGGNYYYSFKHNDTFTKNFGNYLLAAQDLARKDIQRVFKVSRCTIMRILALVRSKGIDALKEYTPGAPSVDAKIKEFVCELFQKVEGTRGYQTIILEQVKGKYDKGEFPRTISRQSLYNILNEYRRQRSQQQAENEQKEKAPPASVWVRFHGFEGFVSVNGSCPHARRGADRQESAGARKPVGNSPHSFCGSVDVVALGWRFPLRWVDARHRTLQGGIGHQGTVDRYQRAA